MSYQAPLDDMRFILFDVFAADKIWADFPATQDLADKETCEAILQSGAKLNAEIVAPLNRNADEQGCRLEQGIVKTPDGFADAYQALIDGGWCGLTGEPAYGGSGMPKMLGIQFDEMMQSASVAFSLYPLLTAGACLALKAHGSDTLKQAYLPKMYSGVWAGSMCLTEPHAGTDLGIIKTKAEANAKGSYSISGTKIFITGGDQDLSENIIHLVLAKLPDAPLGTKGISMFLVPKVLVKDDGSLSEANKLSCGSLEHKMGIKGSSTCVMNFDGAEGYLVGEPHKGLAAMFTMMNYERLGMGVQGVGAGEASYQTAVAYAKDRIQGRSLTGVKSPDAAADAIIHHADIRRMLLTMRSLNEAGRCFINYVAQYLDIAAFSENDMERKQADSLVALLTPVAKGFCTDQAFDVCVAGQQVLGGHGYIREWGQEQLVRDIRIAQIYEGTNGIQAMDLTGRKTVSCEGQLFAVYAKEVEGVISQYGQQYAEFTQPLAEVLGKAQEATHFIVENAKLDPDLIGTSAVAYMHLIGFLCYTHMWNLMAVKAAEKSDADMFLKQKGYTARFFIAHLLPQADSLLSKIKAGSPRVMDLPTDYF